MDGGRAQEVFGGFKIAWLCLATHRSLVVPFLRFGEVISGSNHFPLTSDALRKVVTGQASREVLFSILHALLGWLIAAPFILGILV
ncbi:hypothetical protein AAC387_Pa01g1620 [Persea americana]